MAKKAFLTLIVFGPQFYFGYIGGGLLAPLGWSVGIAMFAIGAGWRAPGRGVFASLLIGMCYAAAANVPIYFIGQWVGNPISRSAVFTSVLCVSGLLIFGLLTFLRRIWPRELADDDKAVPSNVTRISPEVRGLFKKLHWLMNNEKAQVERLPEPLRSEVRSGADCDEIAGAIGDFGHDPRNPIPVNGPLGEMLYLSNLRTTHSQQIVFHRLGCISNVEIFETVSLDGATWDILFLHQYHPRRSRRPPSGYQIVSGAEHNRFLLGTHEFLAAFPTRLSEAIANTSERLLGFRTCPGQVREALRRTIFERPTDHLTRLNIILDNLQRNASP